MTRGAQVELTYSGRLAKGGKPFDTEYAETARLITIGADALPEGVEKAVMTMRQGERATISVKSELAFGESGDPSRGVPPNADVEYDVHLLHIYETSEMVEGKIRKRQLLKGSGWEVPGGLDEITVRWSGVLADSGKPCFEETEITFSADDPTLPTLWKSAVVGQFKKGERAELTVAPELFLGVEGNVELGVPPSASVRLTVELVSWVEVADISAGEDRSLLKAVLSKVRPAQEWGLAQYNGPARE